MVYYIADCKLTKMNGWKQLLYVVDSGRKYWTYFQMH